MHNHLEDSAAERRGQERTDTYVWASRLMRDGWLAYAYFMRHFPEPSDERWEIENAAKNFWEI